MDRLVRLLLGPLRAVEPPGVPRGLYWSTVLAVLALTVSLGMQGTVAALLVIGPRAPQLPAAGLTRMGEATLHPEWDLPVFVAGCALTFALGLAAVLAWNAVLRVRPDRRALPGRRAAASAGLGGLAALALAAASALAFVSRAEALGPLAATDEALPTAVVARLLGPGGTALVVWLACLAAVGVGLARGRTGARP